MFMPHNCRGFPQRKQKQTEFARLNTLNATQDMVFLYNLLGDKSNLGSICIQPMWLGRVSKHSTSPQATDLDNLVKLTGR